jgi:molybdate transport system permease protein
MNGPDLDSPTDTLRKPGCHVAETATALEGAPAIDALGGRSDRPLRWGLYAPLVAYVLLVMGVLAASVIWLGRPNPHTGVPYISSLLGNSVLRGEVFYAFKLSMVTSLITALISTLLAIPSAYALSRLRLPFRAVIDTVVDLPLVIPPLIAGIALLLFFRQSGAGRWIEKHVVEVVYTQKGIIVAQFFIASAFAIRAVKAAFDQVNPRFEAVARSLGASGLRAFVTISLPMAKSGVMAGFIMTWARAVGEFAPVMMLAGSTPGKTSVLPICAFLNMSAGNVEAAIAIVVLMVIIATGTLVLFKRLGGRGYIW